MYCGRKSRLSTSSYGAGFVASTTRFNTFGLTKFGQPAGLLPKTRAINSDQVTMINSNEPCYGNVMLDHCHVGSAVCIASELLDGSRRLSRLVGPTRACSAIPKSPRSQVLIYTLAVGRGF